MAYFTQKDREARLEKHGVTILTEYSDGGAVRRRSSDHKAEDDVDRGVILDKQYFRGAQKLLQETEFNPGILYSFRFPRLEDGRIRCPNCGAVEEEAKFSFGCPYCGTFYNLEYKQKNLGTREHSDYAVKDKKTGLLPVLVCFAPCIALMLLVFYAVSRTHTVFDLIKGLAIGLLLGAAAYLLLFYRRSGTAVTREGIQKKARQDQLLPVFEKALAEMGLTPVEFVNLLHGQLSKYYFGPNSEKREDVIDFDVLDYREQTVRRRGGRPVQISLLLDMRLIRDDGNALTSRELVQRAWLERKKTNGAVVMPETNILSCPNCGASNDLSAETCVYCGTPTAWKSPLVLTRLEPVGKD